MRSRDTPLVHCPSCGADNEHYLEECSTCGGAMDPAIASATGAPRSRAFNVRSALVAAATSVVAVVLASLLGWSLSLRVLPAHATTTALAVQVGELVDRGEIEAIDGEAIYSDIVADRYSRELLSSGKLGPEEAALIRDRLSPIEQSVVLGLGGWRGFGAPLLAFAFAGIAAALASQVRRLREVLAGVSLGLAVQVGLWLWAVDFSVSALDSGRLVLLGNGPLFQGAPGILLGMATVGFAAVSLGANTVMAMVLPNLTGSEICHECSHAFGAKLPPVCPRCGTATQRKSGPVYRADDAFLTELGRASADAPPGPNDAARLCLACAKAYDSDVCPTHPHDPLVDPAAAIVQARMLELDANAGTHRFDPWIQRSEDAGAAAAQQSLGPRLCMACARTYEQDSCPTHRDEPLLDPTNENVRLELIEADDRARRKVSTTLMFVGVAVAATLTIGSMAAIDLDGSVWLSMFAGLTAGSIAVANVFAPKLSPRRFSCWTGEGTQEAAEFSENLDRTIYAPIRRAIRVAADRAAIMAVVTVVVAGVGAALGFALGWSPIALAAFGALVGFVGALVGLSITDGTRRVAADIKQARAAWKDPYA